MTKQPIHVDISSQTHLARRFGLLEFSLAFYIFTTFMFSQGDTINAIAKVFLGTIFFFSFLGRKRFTLTPFLLACILFLILSLASLSWTLTPEASLSRVTTFIYQVVCYVAIVNMISWKRERLEFCLSWVVISAIATGANVTLINGVSFQDDRYAEGVVSAGQLALACALAIAVCVYRFVRSHKAIYLLAIVPLGIFLVLSSGRRGFLIVVLFAAFFALLNSRSIGKKILALVGAVGIIFGSYALLVTNDFFYANVGRRMESFLAFLTADGVGDASTQGRQRLIDFGLALFNDAKIVGNGIDSFETLFTATHASWLTSADNNYIQLLADLGILGFLAYYIPMLVFLFRGLRGVHKKNLTARFGLAVVLAMCCIDFATVWFFSQIGMLMIVLCYQAVRMQARNDEVFKT